MHGQRREAIGYVCCRGRDWRPVVRGISDLVQTAGKNSQIIKRPVGVGFEVHHRAGGGVKIKYLAEVGVHNPAMVFQTERQPFDETARVIAEKQTAVVLRREHPAAIHRPPSDRTALPVMSVSVKRVFKTTAAAITLGQRPAVVVAFHDMIHFLPALLTDVADEHLAAQRIKLETKGIPEAIRPDLRPLASLPHKRVVAWSAAVGTETDDFAERGTQILGIAARTVVADGQINFAVRPELHGAAD